MVGAGAKGSPRNLSLHITNRLLGAASSAPKEVASAICRALHCLPQPLSASPEEPKESPKEAPKRQRQVNALPSFELDLLNYLYISMYI